MTSFRLGHRAAHTACAGLILLSMGGLSSVAHAQDVAAGPGTSDDKQAATSIGVKVSDSLVFHPSVSVGGGYQTNVFFEDKTVAPGETSRIIDSPILQAGVGLSLQTNNAPPSTDGEAPALGPKVVFGGSMNLTWNQYLEEQAKDFSDVGIGALIGATFNPQGKASPYVRGGYTRAITPPRGLSVDDVDRDKVNAVLGSNFKPGGGALTVFAQYEFMLDIFERSDLEFANRQAHTGRLGARYQWLPKTQFFTEAQLGFVAPDRETALKSDSAVPLRLSAGVLTLLTQSFGTVLRIGYANSFNSSGPDFNSVTAMAEGRLSVGPTLKTAFGYQRDFQDSVIANFFDEHTIYARIAAQLGTLAQLNLRSEVRFRSYAYDDAMGPVVFMPPAGGSVTFCSDAACTGSDRSDTLYGVHAGIDVPVKDWVVLGATYALLVDDTKFETRTPAADKAEFVWQEFMLKATARY